VDNETAPQRTRRIALLLAGASDCLFGGLLLLAWLGFLPIDLSGLGLPDWALGLVGAVLFFPGLALVTYLLTRPSPPE
jgi:hypothetical protein